MIICIIEAKTIFCFTFLYYEENFINCTCLDIANRLMGKATK